MTAPARLICEDALQPPMPWFGGKSRVADLVWSRFGDVPNYVECFFGSGAVLLARPHAPRIETINDLDGYVANFWRAVKLDPEQSAYHADNPVNENDLHARHSWLLTQRDTLAARLDGDPEFYDPKIAGYWVWGICCWIGSGFCSGAGPWHVRNGMLVKDGDAGRGVKRQLPHLGDAGRGVNRGDDLIEYFQALANRLRHVRVCCGDWTRVMGPGVTFKNGLTGVFLDPPYGEDANRNNTLYRCESGTVAGDVREWALENGDNPELRIAICGYQDEHEFPASWECVPWKATGGYASQRKAQDAVNSTRERIWFSPACLKPELDLFAARRMADKETMA